MEGKHQGDLFCPLGKMSLWCYSSFENQSKLTEKFSKFVLFYSLLTGLRGHAATETLCLDYSPVTVEPTQNLGQITHFLSRQFGLPPLILCLSLTHLVSPPPLNSLLYRRAIHVLTCASLSARPPFCKPPLPTMWQ